MTDFKDLPIPETTGGQTRLCGVEIEFTGLSETKVADILQAEFDGKIVETGPRELDVKDSALGDLHVELDTVWRKSDTAVIEVGLDLVRDLVPVEIVTPPLSCAQIGQLNDSVSVLREAGAIGSRGGVLLGFGVHLNPAVVALDHPHTLRTIRAFGLIEDGLRKAADIDNTRRLMPFVDRWPAKLVDDLARGTPDNMVEMMKLYARHTRSRNHGLDLLPLFMEADPELHKRLFPKDKTSARPAFHFRLPDSRIDEPGWSLKQSWDMWRQVEEIAANEEFLDDLAEAWLAHRGETFSTRGGWAERVLQLTNGAPA